MNSLIFLMKFGVLLYSQNGLVQPVGYKDSLKASKHKNSMDTFLEKKVILPINDTAVTPVVTNHGKFIFHVNGEMYFGLNSTLSPKKESFAYNHKLNNRLRTNLLLLQGEYNADRMHAKLGVMTGDYARYNLKSEPQWAKPLYEAFVGFSPLKKSSLWLDIGVFPSYIGFETPVAMENAMLTRSVVADNSPYYFSGLRATLSSKNKKYDFAAYVLNGWQRIAPQQDNKIPALGLNLKRNINQSSSVSYGLFYGTIYPDSLRINRLYQHVNTMFSIGKWSYWGSLDVGLEKGYLWGAFQAVAQWRLHSLWTLSQRIESYIDPHNRCIRIGENDPSILVGLSFCLDYKITDWLHLRLEPKGFISSEALWFNKSVDGQFNTSLSFRF